MCADSPPSAAPRSGFLHVKTQYAIDYNCLDGQLAVAPSESLYGFQADEEPIIIDLVSPGDLIAIYSVDIHGNEYVKVHSVSDISTTQGAKKRLQNRSGRQ